MNKRVISQIIPLILVPCMAECCHKSKDVSNEEGAALTSDSIPSSVIIDFDNASELSDNLQGDGIITFDENTENILGGLQQAVVRGDTVFAVDPAKNPGLYAYLKDGSQLFAYCDNGSGPEDIGSPISLAVTDSEITVFDLVAKKLISFTKDGRFKHATELSMDVTAAIKDSEGGIWTDLSNQKYGDAKLMWRKDEESDPTTVLNVPKHLKGMTTVQMMTLVQLADGELRYMPSIEPYVYALRNGEAVMLYELDFMGKWPSDNEIATEYQGDGWARKYMNFPIHSRGLAENDRWLVVGTNYDKKLYITVYDKLNRTSRTYVDSTQEYYNPLYIDGTQLYMYRCDDAIEILKLE